MSNLNFQGFFFLHFDSQLLRLSSQFSNQKYFENMEHHRKDTKPFQIRVEETVKKLEALHKPRNRLTMRKICKLFFVLSVCITLGIAMLLLLLYVWYCFESWYPGVKLLMLEPCKDCKNQFDAAVDRLLSSSKDILWFCIFAAFKYSPYLIIGAIFVTLVKMNKD